MINSNNTSEHFPSIACDRHKHVYTDYPTLTPEKLYDFLISNDAYSIDVTPNNIILLKRNRFSDYFSKNNLYKPTKVLMEILENTDLDCLTNWGFTEEYKTELMNYLKPYGRTDYINSLLSDAEEK